jgi:hypothetical protein
MILRVVLWAVLIARKLKSLLVGPAEQTHHTHMLCVFDTDVQNAALHSAFHKILHNKLFERFIFITFCTMCNVECSLSFLPWKIMEAGPFVLR